jgi:hypothetical protein
MDIFSDDAGVWMTHDPLTRDVRHSAGRRLGSDRCGPVFRPEGKSR